MALDNHTTIGKTLKVAAYVGISAVIAYLVTAVQGDAELFGPYTAAINVALVFVKNLIDANTPNA